MALWGMHFVVIRIGALEIPPLLLLSLRFFFCTLLLLPFAKKITREDFKNIFLYAFPLQTLHMATLFLGLEQMDAGITSLIIQVEFPFLVLLGWFFYKERFGLKTSIGLLTALAGGALLVYQPHEDANVTLIGVILIIISALAWAIGSVRAKYISHLNFPTMLGYAFASSLPFIIIASLIFEQDQLQAIQQADHFTLGWVLAYQVILISLSHFWWTNIMARNPVYLITPFTVLVPIFAVIFSILILGEALSTTTIIGGVVALTGIAIVSFRQAKKKVVS